MNTRISSIITVIGCCLLAISFTSCNDEWKDEQYEKYISFKAPINDNGVTAIYVPYSRHNDDGSLMYGSEGKSSYDLPVIVAGTTTNGSNLTVQVGHSDTLNILNYELFGSPTYRADIIDLYYKDNVFSFIVAIIEMISMFGTGIYFIVINDYTSDVFSMILGVIFLIIGSLRIIDGLGDLVRSAYKRRNQ